MEQVDKDTQGADRAVWASNMLMQGQNLFGFTCAGYERDPEEWVANLYRLEGGEPVPDDFPVRGGALLASSVGAASSRSRKAIM